MARRNVSDSRKALKGLKEADEENHSGGRPFWVYGIISFILLLPLAVMIMALLVPMAFLAIVVNAVVEIPGMKMAGKALTTIGCALGNDTACAIKEIMDEVEAAGIDDVLKAETDCQNQPPDFPQEWCDKSALDPAEDVQFPMPEDKRWMIPIYIKAGADNDVPWELLAAIHATRTNFGADNCPTTNDGGILGRKRVTGGGQFAFTKNEWIDFGYDAGKVSEFPTIYAIRKMENVPPKEEWGKIAKNDKDCVAYKPKLRTKIEKKDALADNRKKAIDEKGSLLGNDEELTDPVDAIYTEARILKYYKLSKSKHSDWIDYTGGPANMCAGVGADMPWKKIYHYNGSGGAIPLPQEIIELGEKWTFINHDSMTFPNSAVTGEDEAFRSAHVVPEEVRMKFYYAIGEAMGMPRNVIKKVIPNLENLSKGESGWDSSRIQGVISGDPNNAWSNRARGIFQFTPGTFQGAHVPGYDNIYNPLHNTMAAMNAMLHATSMYAGPPPSKAYDNHGKWGLWPQRSGWSPGYTNPYAGQDVVSEPEGPYTGTAIDMVKDPYAKAVGSRPGPGKYYDPCYVAVVQEWYTAFRAVSFAMDGIESGSGFSFEGVTIPPPTGGEAAWHYLFRVGAAIGLKSDCGDNVNTVDPNCNQIQGGSHSSDSDHYVARAIDWGNAKNGGGKLGKDNTVLERAAAFFVAYQKQLCVKQVIWRWDGHYNHIHVAIYKPSECPDPYPAPSLLGENGNWKTAKPSEEVTESNDGSAPGAPNNLTGAMRAKVLAASRRATTAKVKDVSGKISWYGGPNDQEDNDKPASGVPNTVPGIAIMNSKTLGGWWKITIGQKTIILQQTDLGPHPRTKRKIDFNYTAVRAFGYTEASFPTDAEATAKYLGKEPPEE